MQAKLVAPRRRSLTLAKSSVRLNTFKKYLNTKYKYFLNLYLKYKYKYMANKVFENKILVFVFSNTKYIINLLPYRLKLFSFFPRSVKYAFLNCKSTTFLSSINTCRLMNTE